MSLLVGNNIFNKRHFLNLSYIHILFYVHFSPGKAFITYQKFCLFSIQKLKLTILIERNP
jgi:hypothetical protein